MQPLLYDVFSGAGGAAYGYMQAGFRVVGIDNRPQPRYPGDGFIQMDVFEFFDRVEAGEYEPPACWHASPPCQKFTPLRALHPEQEYPNLIPPTREQLEASGLPYIIENVPGAPLLEPLMLCGVMFGLRVYRHRLFETSFPVLQPGHPRHTGTANSHRRAKGYRNAAGRSYPMGDYITVAGNNFEMVSGSAAMGIGWMAVRRELAQAIPPAYTEWLGQQALRVLGLERVA